jgi:anaerobic selenocysteine-containing dehydrogenase
MAADPPSRLGVLRLGRYRPIWAAPEVEISPALQFTVAEQTLELAPEDAGRMGVVEGETVEVVGRNGGPPEPDAPRVRARANIRTGVSRGTAFLADGIRSDSANVLTEPLIEVVRR